MAFPDTRQLLIVHLSDVHFGKYHRFNLPPTAAGDVAHEEGYPTLAEKLAEDLSGDDPGCPVMLAITGDLVETGAYEELEDAERFVRELAQRPLLGRPRGLNDIYLVPGNHDLTYDGRDLKARWREWISFHNGLRDTKVASDRPSDLDGVEDRTDDLGAIVATINSACRVEKGKNDQVRGHVDNSQLERLETRLEAIAPDRRESAIRIALIHHHPVLIPELVEGGRGYDAVHNSGQLIALLRKYGFHLILHGHKHNPHVFTANTAAAYRSGEHQHLLVAAGGSLGSTELTEDPRCANCYNRIIVKWHAAVSQTRIQVTTRGLQRFDDDGSPWRPTRWRWDTLRVDDRQFLGGDGVPAPRNIDWRSFDQRRDGTLDTSRIDEYRRLRGYFPVVAVMPSLVPDQAYEARLWMVHHRPQEQTISDPIVKKVTWSAGSKFPVLTVTADQDECFCAVYHYWGPMLVQATIEFSDGHTVDAHVYARLPEPFPSF